MISRLGGYLDCVNQTSPKGNHANIGKYEYNHFFLETWTKQDNHYYKPLLSLCYNGENLINVISHITWLAVWMNQPV